MLKSWRLITFISVAVALTAPTFDPAVSFPIGQKKQVLEIASLDDNVPLCYMETGAGTVLDLSNFCQEEVNNLGTTNSEINSVTPVPNSNSSGSSSQRRVNSVRPFQNPYNNSNIKKFDDELYGEEQ